MNKPRVLISGAGIAGPALALCLARFGFRTTVVERASALRPGGQAVDFRGPVHRAVLERLDLWDAIHARRTAGSSLVLLDEDGSPFATLPAVMMSGDVEIQRGDLSRLLYERTREIADYRFGDRIVALEERGSTVAVAFERGREETFDLVVGADGLHSGVRSLAFGEEAKFLRHHGYRIATFALPNFLPVEAPAFLYTTTGRGVLVGATSRTEARALLVQQGPAFDGESRDASVQKPLWARAFEGLGWEVPRIVEKMAEACDLYVDAIGTVHVDRYGSGRVALLGDAAYGGTLGGQGTPLAIVGAYVLAEELAAHPIEVAFERYERKMRPYATRCQKIAMRAGSFFAPATRVGLAARKVFYRALTSRPLRGVFEWMVKDAATDFELPERAPSRRPSSNEVAAN